MAFFLNIGFPYIFCIVFAIFCLKVEDKIIKTQWTSENSIKKTQKIKRKNFVILLFFMMNFQKHIETSTTVYISSHMYQSIEFYPRSRYTLWRDIKRLILYLKLVTGDRFFHSRVISEKITEIWTWPCLSLQLFSTFDFTRSISDLPSFVPPKF